MTKTASENSAGTIKGIAEGRCDTFRVDPDNLVVVEDKSHPLYDERVTLDLDETFIQDIMENGVVLNVLVRKNGPLFEVVDGRQRVKAAVEANKRFKKAHSDKRILVPVTVRRDDDTQSAGLTISLNEQRTEDTPMVKARKAQRLIDLGEAEEKVANRFRTNVQGLRAMLAVLDSDKSVQNLVESGELHVTAASKLSKLTRDEQREEIAKLRASGKGLSKKVIKQAVRNKVEAKRTGKDAAEVILPPKRALIAAVCDGYHDADGSTDDGKVQPEHLLRWILTGQKAEKVSPGPEGFATLAAWLKDRDKPKVKVAAGGEGEKEDV